MSWHYHANSSLKYFTEDHRLVSKWKLSSCIRETYWPKQHTWVFSCLKSEASGGVDKCSGIITVHTCVDEKDDITELQTNQQNKKTQKKTPYFCFPSPQVNKTASNQERLHWQTTIGGFTLMFSFFEKALNAFLVFLQKLLHFPGVLFLSECHQ